MLSLIQYLHLSIGNMLDSVLISILLLFTYLIYSLYFMDEETEV